MSKLKAIESKIEELEALEASLVSDLARLKNTFSQAYTDRQTVLAVIREKLADARERRLDEILGPGGEIPAAEPVPAR